MRFSGTEAFGAETPRFDGPMAHDGQVQILKGSRPDTDESPASVSVLSTLSHID